MKYQICDIVKIDKHIGIIIKTRMWNEEVDYKLIISGRPNEPIWILERLILEKI
jgi:hypothetical protein